MHKVSSQDINNFVHSSVGFVVKFYNVILAALMVIYSSDRLYENFVYYYLIWYETLGYLFLLIGGLIILLDRNRNLLRSVGIYALALGGYRFITYAPHIHPGPIGLFYLVITGLGINLMISGRYYLQGVSRNRISLMVSTLTILLVYMLALVFTLHMGASVRVILTEYTGQVIVCLMYAIYIGILDSETLRASDILAIHNEVLNKIRCTQYTDSETYIPLDVANVLSRAFEDRSDWTPVTDGGPATCEYRFGITNKDGRSEVLVQKWNTSDELYFTVSDHLDGTLIQAYRFSATSSILFTDELDCRWLRVFGRQGVCMQLRVDNPDIEAAA